MGPLVGLHYRVPDSRRKSYGQDGWENFLDELAPKSLWSSASGGSLQNECENETTCFRLAEVLSGRIRSGKSGGRTNPLGFRTSRLAKPGSAPEFSRFEPLHRAHGGVSTGEEFLLAMGLPEAHFKTAMKRLILLHPVLPLNRLFLA